MGNPAKVLNFFDVLGTWDPSLAFVMGGALAVLADGLATHPHSGRLRVERLENLLAVVQEEGPSVDLLPVATKYYYHPDQHGSWSIKKVLPTIAPELSYDTLTTVQNGGGAQQAYLEAIAAAMAACIGCGSWPATTIGSQP